MFTDIILVGAFCMVIMGAVAFIKKMPSHELVKDQDDINNL